MYKSKLVQNLTLLSPKQLTRFQDFVHSPFFNKKKKVAQLLDLIITTKNWKNAFLNKKAIHKRLYPEASTYKERTINQIMSDLQQLFYAFLSQLNFEKQEGFAQSLAVLESSQLQSVPLTEKLIKRTLKKIPQHSSNPLDQLALLHIHAEIANIDLTHKNKSNIQSYEAIIEHLDTSYIIFKTICYMSIYSFKKHYNLDMDTKEEYINKVFQTLQKKHPDNILINTFILSFNLWHYQRLEDYELVKEITLKNLPNYNIHLKTTVLKSLSSFCAIRQISSPEEHMRLQQDAFLWTQLIIEHKIIEAEKAINRFEYSLMFNSGFNLQKLDWCADFVDTYTTYLSDEHREKIYVLQYSTLLIAQKKLDEARDLLNTVEFTVDVDYANKQLLLIKLYYEQKEFISLDYLLESFRIYNIRHPQIAADLRKNRTKFVQLSKKLVMLSTTPLSPAQHSKKKEELITKIKQEAILEKHWLLEKAQAI